MLVGYLQIHSRAGDKMNEKFEKCMMRSKAKVSALTTISSSLYIHQVGVLVNKLRTESN